MVLKCAVLVTTYDTLRSICIKRATVSFTFYTHFSSPPLVLILLLLLILFADGDDSKNPLQAVDIIVITVAAIGLIAGVWVITVRLCCTKVSSENNCFFILFARLVHSLHYFNAIF